MNPAFCRDCLIDGAQGLQCPQCGSPRLLRHPARDDLSIAHVDCDAFYAAIEKRDNPAWQDKPLIVGGGRRGVVSTCCYIARMSGVRSAMPMYKALEACPDAIVTPPDMAKYQQVSQQVRKLLDQLTPIVEPLSIDEAFLDMQGTAALHHASPALTLARFQKQLETQIGITVSIGLSVNKFLAKFASDLNKPRGFTLLSQLEGQQALAPLPVDRLWGVGAASARRLNARGFRTIGELQTLDDLSALKLLGEDGVRLARLARGEDNRSVSPDRARKSISTEITFAEDLAAMNELEPRLRRCADRVGADLRSKGLRGKRLTLKLKTDRFQTITRSRTLPVPTSSTAEIIGVLLPILQQLCDGTAYRLIGVGAELSSDAQTEQSQLPLDPRSSRRATLEKTVDQLRHKTGTALGFGSAGPQRSRSHPSASDEA